MEKLDFNTLLDLEEVFILFERIERIIIILQENYFSKNEVDFTNFNDYYDLCASYKNITTLLDVIKDIANNGYKHYNNLLNSEKKEIENE